MPVIRALLCAALVSAAALAQQAPAWNVELDEPVQLYEFLENGRFLFFNSGPHAWAYDAETGKQSYHIEVEDFEKMGVHTLIGSRYVVSYDDGMVCYDALTGKVLWKKAYKDIDQDEFLSYEFILTTAVFRFGSTELAVNLESGAELWRAEIHYEGDLVEKGTFNYRVLEGTGKMLVIEDDETIALYDVSNGKKVLTVKDAEVNQDLIEEKHAWMSVSPDDKYAVIVLEEAVVAIDAAQNKMLGRYPLEIDGDYDVLFQTTNGCSVFGEKKILNISFATGKTADVPYAVGDVRTMQHYTVAGKDILLISAKNRVVGIDLTAGAKLWESKPGDPQFEGFIHRYLRTDGSDAIVSYVKAGTFSTSSGGTWVHALRLDLLTGAVKYKTLTGIAKTAISDIGRAAGKLAGSIVNALRSGRPGNSITKSFGYENVGFEYETLDYAGKLVFLFRNKVAMANPLTNEEPGEGFCAIDPTSGAVAYQEYFALMYNTSWSAAGQGVAAYTPAPLMKDGIAYLCGSGRIVAFDMNAGKKLWTVEKELNEGYPTDIALIDGTVYVKFGKDPVAATLDKRNVDVDSPWEHDPHGFAAIDATTGKFLWKFDRDDDPGILLPQFSINNYYNAKIRQIYFADEEKLYALGLKPDGGKLVWILDFEKSKFGEMATKKIFAVNETWLGTVPRTTTSTHGLGGGATLTTSSTSGGMSEEGAKTFIEDAEGAEAVTTYTSWGNIWGVTAKRCLRILFDAERILVIGPDRIGMVDAAKGMTSWTREWDYNPAAVQYIPRVVNGKLVYAVDEELTCLDISTGKVVWKAEVTKTAKFFLAPDQSFLYSIDAEMIAGYKL